MISRVEAKVNIKAWRKRGQTGDREEYGEKGGKIGLRGIEMGQYRAISRMYVNVFSWAMAVAILIGVAITSRSMTGFCMGYSMRPVLSTES